MVPILLSLNVILLVAAGIFLNLFLRYRGRLHRAENRYGKEHIPRVLLNEIDPVFSYSELGLPLNTEVRFLGSGNLPISGTTSDTEAWILSVLSLEARTMFEFGTGTGRIAYLWAVNSPPDARITTLALHPDQVNDYEMASQDSAKGKTVALRESCHQRFIYAGTPVEHKVTQVFSDSKKFDEEPFRNSCDLVFIDGSHTLSYIANDTEKALRMVKPGGLILWHDYRRGSEPRDVEVFLNQLSATRKLRHIAGTSLVVYRHE